MCYVAVLVAGALGEAEVVAEVELGFIGADTVPLRVAAEGIGLTDGSTAEGVLAADRVMLTAAVARGVDADVETATNVAEIPRLAGAEAVPLGVAAEWIEVADLQAA